MNAAERKKKGLTLARKVHECRACFQPILPGEIYKSMECLPWAGDNDDFDTLRVCRFCDSQDSCWYEDGHLWFVSEEHRADCRDHWSAKVSAEFGFEVDLDWDGYEYEPNLLDLAEREALGG